MTLDDKTTRCSPGIVVYSSTAKKNKTMNTWSFPLAPASQNLPSSFAVDPPLRACEVTACEAFTEPKLAGRLGGEHRTFAVQCLDFSQTTISKKVKCLPTTKGESNWKHSRRTCFERNRTWLGVIEKTRVHPKSESDAGHVAIFTFPSLGRQTKYSRFTRFKHTWVNYGSLKGTDSSRNSP